MFDLAIIGAGPAGMSAALTAADHGLTVVVIDEQQRAGGQIFRQPPETFTGSVLHPTAGYGWATELIRRFEADSRLTTEFGWSAIGVLHDDAEPDGLCVAINHPEHGTRVIGARRLLIATGAYDLPVAFPGWTLPGVMTAAWCPDPRQGAEDRTRRRRCAGRGASAAAARGRLARPRRRPRARDRVRAEHPDTDGHAPRPRRPARSSADARRDGRDPDAAGAQGHPSLAPDHRDGRPRHGTRLPDRARQGRPAVEGDRRTPRGRRIASRARVRLLRIDGARPSDRMRTRI